MRLASSLISVVAFVVVVFGAPIHEAVHGNWPGRGLGAPTDFEEVRSGKYAQRLEERLEAETTLEDVARPRYNELRFLVTGETNPGVVVGEDDWLFLEMRLGEPGPAARATIPKIVDAMGSIVRHLESKGCLVLIELVPRKQSLYPEKTPKDAKYPFVPMFEVVYDEMVDEGLPVLDLREVLGGPSGPWHLTNDAHWRPEGLHRVATLVAERIRAHFGDAGVPGRPIELDLHWSDPREFIGYEQRLLGFAENGWLYNRYTNTVREITAIEPGNPERRFFGSEAYEPITLIGSSMSQGPYYQVSQLMGLLDVHIRNVARDGFAGGYRSIDALAGALTGRMPYPEVLIWEVPEDFISREADYYLEPLESLAALLPNAPYRPVPVPLDGMVIDRIDQHVVDGRVTYSTQGPEGSVTIPLPEAVDGSAPTALSIAVTVPPGSPTHAGHTVVEWGDDPEEPPIGTKTVTMRITHWMHPILVQLEGGTPERPIRYIRVRPFDHPSPIKMSGTIELWISEAGNDGGESK